MDDRRGIVLNAGNLLWRVCRCACWPASDGLPTLIHCDVRAAAIGDGALAARQDRRASPNDRNALADSPREPPA